MSLYCAYTTTVTSSAIPPESVREVTVMACHEITCMPSIGG